MLCLRLRDQFWSGGALKSTQHRVIMPQDDNKASPRFSIAYFVQPDFDTALEVMSGQ
jgi:isopenicillin N synthase-like dioxygenase